MTKLLKLSEIAEYLSISMHHSTVVRWTRKGVILDGKQIVLPSKRIGNRIYVDETDLCDFINKLNQQSPDLANANTSPVSIKAEEKRQAERSQRLDEIGV